MATRDLKFVTKGGDGTRAPVPGTAPVRSTRSPTREKITFLIRKDGTGVREVPPLNRREWIKAKRLARKFYADRTRKWKAYVRQRNQELGFGAEAECSETSPSEFPFSTDDDDEEKE